jgi:chemotaxis protein histidine kinase CheA
MRVHHRIPSIFTLSMVDVLCCALGCVILLWLLNLREAKEHEDTAGESARLAAAQLADTEADRDFINGMLTQADHRLAELTEERNRLRARLAEQTTAYRKLDEQVKAAHGQVESLQLDAASAEARTKSLKSVADAVPALRAELREARERYGSEEALAKALEKDVAGRMRELTDAAKTLQVMQAARQALERELAAKDKELETANNYKSRWAASAGRVAELEKLVEERGRAAATAKQALELLEEDKKALRAEAARYRQSADNRFAGIQLAGRRVVFLVDMSGSMELVDETTPAPAKWSGVRETLAKIMKSLPDLQQFQVIVFSERATFLLGSPDAWIDYDAGVTPDKVVTGLAAIKPTGGTNMYTALDAAFRFRDRGLDTIYLFSDGLPNLGEGLSAEQSRTLKEVEQSEILGKYIRKKLRTDWNAPVSGQRVHINAVGFFYESPDVGAFLWALARENEGSFVGMSRP